MVFAPNHHRLSRHTMFKNRLREIAAAVYIPRGMSDTAMATPEAYRFGRAG